VANLAALRAELDADPLTRGYAGMTDAQAADSLNTEDRSLGTVTTQDLFQAVDWDEWAANYATMDAAKLAYWGHLLTQDSIDVSATQVQRALINNTVGIFTNAAFPLTRAAIVALPRAISRAVELNLGRVLVGTVTEARAL